MEESTVPADCVFGSVYDSRLSKHGENKLIKNDSVKEDRTGECSEMR